MPTNSPFESVGELQRVLGVTPALMARIAPSLTVYSRQAGHQPCGGPAAMSCSRMPAATPEQVDAYIAAREGRPDEPPADARRSLRRQGFAAAAAPVWRIHVLARAADGVTFARDAVVRSLNDPQRPLVTLLWQEGAQDPTSETPTTGTSAQENGTGKP